MTGPGNLILWIVAGTFAAMCAFILVLLARIMLRRSPRSDLTRIGASRHSWRDLGWMALALIVVALVAVPLARLLYLQKTTRVADLTIRATGKMWHWTYEYPDYGNLSFDVPMLSTAVAGKASDLKPADTRNHIVLPVGKTVRIVSIGTNLFYSWTIPSIGAAITGLPGRTNESWFRADKEGVYFGQPSELCALLHTFEPVEVEVVSQEHFDKWVAEAGKRVGSVAAPQPRVVTAAQ